MRVAWLVLLLVLGGVGEACAQDLNARISVHQQQLDRLEDDFTASQVRMLGAPNRSAAQELAYGQLDSVNRLLGTINRELSVLTMVMGMELLVQGESRTKQARRIVELQKELIVKKAMNSSAYVEKVIPIVRDAETSRLLFEARDSIKATAELLRQQ